MMGRCFLLPVVLLAFAGAGCGGDGSSGEDHRPTNQPSKPVEGNPAPPVEDEGTDAEVDPDAPEALLATIDGKGDSLTEDDVQPYRDVFAKLEGNCKDAAPSRLADAAAGGYKEIGEKFSTLEILEETATASEGDPGRSQTCTGLMVGVLAIMDNE